MNFNLLTHQHRHAGSVIHHLPAGLKLGVALIVIVGNVCVPLTWQAWFLGVAIFLILVAGLSRISPWFLLKRILALSPLVLGVALVNAFQTTGQGHWLGVAERSLLCLLTVTLVSNTTPFSGILRVLKSVRVPSLLITTIALMHRYLFVVAEEAGRMHRARASRTFGRTRRFQWHTLSSVVSQLFIRASERAERVYDAMCARGWK